MAALFLFQITIVGILGLKKAAAPSILVIPLLFFTVAFHSYCVDYFHEKALHLPAFEAKKKDDDTDNGLDTYLQPALAAVIQPDYLAAEIEQKKMTLGHRGSDLMNAVSL
jgi:hypothetical protein